MIPMPIDRKERAARAAAKPKVKARQSATYWLTRDSASGVLQVKVTVWLAPPRRVRVGEVVYWTCGDARVGLLSDDGKSYDAPARHGEWRLESCATIPDDDRQAIRVGPAKLAAPIVSGSVGAGA